MKKTTSQKLSKRLTQYGALTAALAGVASANGQIVYHDIVDVTGSSDYSINLNPIDGITPIAVADAIDDLRIFNTGSVLSSARIDIELFNNNSALASASLFTYPFALNSEYAISSANQNWLNNQFQRLLYASDCYNGNWCNATDKYLGLRFDIKGKTHYGWAKLSVDASTVTWVLKEFAFNATPDEAINTGQTTLGTDDNQFSKTKIVASNKSIALYNLPQQTDYKVLNMSGQKVLDGKIVNQTHVIEANTLAKGIYIIELQDVNSYAVIRKKIVL